MPASIAPAMLTTGAVWINIHAEPHMDPAEHASRLESLLDLADSYGHKVTVLFSAQWLQYLLDTPDYLSVLAWYFHQGHRIGFHHHDLTHVNPDGYQSLPYLTCIANHSWLDCQRHVSFSFFGVDLFSYGSKSVGEGIQLLEDVAAELVASHHVDPALFVDGFAANHGTSAEYRDYEWQEGAAYSQGDQTDHPPLDTDNAGALAKPGCVTYNGFAVPETGGKHYDVGNRNNSITLQEVVDDIGRAEVDEMVGISLHAWEFRSDNGDSAAIDELFSTLSDMTAVAVPMQDLLAAQVSC